MGGRTGGRVVVLGIAAGLLFLLGVTGAVARQTARTVRFVAAEPVTTTSTAPPPAVAEATTTTTAPPPTTATTVAPTTTTTTEAPPPPTTTTTRPPVTVPPVTVTVPPPPRIAAPAPAPAPGGCDPNYSGCVPIASDVDCAGGSGNGPAYVTGPVQVIGTDIYGLDGNDNDGVGCEP